MDSGVKRDLAILIGLALCFKVFTVLLTNSLHSFVDIYDYSYYFEHMVMISNGKIPYVDFPFDYPTLAIVPMMTAFLVSGTNISTFVIVFQLFMLICDALIIVGMYTIALLIWNNRKRASLAGLLYACSLPIAYFTITKFDAFPTMMLVWAVAYTLYNRPAEGYLMVVLGGMTKVFPFIAAPFLVIWNWKAGRDLKKECIVFGVLAISTLILIVPFLVAGAGITDIFTVLTRGEVYPNTPAYLLHIYTGISADVFSVIALCLAIFAVGILIAVMWKGKRSPVLLIEVIAMALIAVVYAAPLHSPQYLMWYMPFLCLLVGTDLVLIGLLVLSNIIAYIEFPLLFGSVWTNAKYINQGAGVVLFTIEFLVMAILLIKIWWNYNRPHV